MKYSIVIPVYRNAEHVEELVSILSGIGERLDGGMEAVFVIDGSPDNSWALLSNATARLPMPVQILGHSRNFGSFAAVRTGLGAARGDYFAVLAADLQEPPDLLISFFRSLAADECDVAIGTRESRDDPLFSRLSSNVFWSFYRRTIVPDMPAGGVDVFGCNRQFRDELMKLEESRSSLVALVFWLGFRRKFLPYKRSRRRAGKSGWTLAKKLEYMADSLFAFTDYPIRMLIRVGFFGAALAALLAVLTVVWRLTGVIEVPGYAATLITVLFFGMLNLFALGIVGTYAWRAYENSKHRPHAVVARRSENDASRKQHVAGS